MTSDADASRLREFFEAFNEGDWPRVQELLTNGFFDYQPQEGEPSAPQVFSEIGADLRGGFPDLTVSLGDITSEDAGDIAPEDRGLQATMTARGSFVGHLWGLQGSGKEISVEATVVVRTEDSRIAMRWDDVNFIGMLREVGLAPLPENMHKKHDPVVTLPEHVYRLAFNHLRLEEKPCTHLDKIVMTEVTSRVCEQCESTGTEYPAVRMCLTCGFTGCCDASTNKHTMKHWEETGHAIVRSAQPGESWLWCYPDKAFLSSRHLAGKG